MEAEFRQQLYAKLWPEGLSTRVNVWAVLDGARDKRIFSAVDRSYQDKTCLYSGALPWQLQMAAPYLVQLDKEDRMSRYILENGWGDSWGVYLRSETSMKNLRHHLRGFLRVRDDRGRRLIFRYYDPRVLRVYLPTCNRDELHQVFGPIDEFMIESDDGNSILVCRFNGQRLEQERVTLAAAPSIAGKAE